jgi:hypothetical protein
MRTGLRKSLLLILFLIAACQGPGHVEFNQGRCLIDGEVATLERVEDRQTRVTHRILSRQPFFTLITLLVVVLAGASHAEKVVFLFSTRRRDVKGIGERVKLALDRYRAHPVRYFVIVSTTMALLLVAAGCYIYLDADKRASERALGMLQFCHLALRTEEEKSVLDEQRHNLLTIQETAGDIRQLVGKLPPEEKRKAEEIVGVMGTALSKQGKIVGQYLQRSDQTTRDMRDHAQAVERSLSTVEADIVTLKAIPTSLHDLGSQMQKLDGALKTVDTKIGTSDGRLATVDEKLGVADSRLAQLEADMKTLAARPACPACVCAEKPATARSAADPPEAPARAAPAAAK